MKAKVDYGLDAPAVILGAIGAGVVATGVGAVVRPLRPLAYVGATIAVASAATYWSSRHGKLGVRDRVLDALDLRGDERVLDVGCGRGLLLVGAAKRLPTGRAVGLDLWSSADQLGNRREVTLRNAELEGVAERVEVVDGDMTQMPFSGGSFDVVVSNLAIHNVPSVAGRRRSIEEIARVLRPGGQFALVDLAFTRRYARWLEDAGCTDVQHHWPAQGFFPPLGIVTGRRA